MATNRVLTSGDDDPSALGRVSSWGDDVFAGSMKARDIASAVILARPCLTLIAELQRRVWCPA